MKHKVHKKMNWRYKTLRHPPYNRTMKRVDSKMGSGNVEAETEWRSSWFRRKGKRMFSCRKRSAELNRGDADVGNGTDSRVRKEGYVLMCGA